MKSSFLLLLSKVVIASIVEVCILLYNQSPREFLFSINLTDKLSPYGLLSCSLQINGNSLCISARSHASASINLGWVYSKVLIKSTRDLEQMHSDKVKS